jgi:hypothetical protein
VARFESDRAAVLARAWAAGVRGILVPAIGPEGWDVFGMNAAGVVLRRLAHGR